MTERMMRALAFETLGPDATPGLIETPLPRPGPGEIRVGVRYSVINPADLLLQSGAASALFPDASGPFWGGLEFSGTVEEVGAEVDLPVGTPVAGVAHFAGTGRGAHAEHVVVPAQSVAPLPPGMSFELAACVPMSGLTALLAIDRIGLRRGDRLAVVGAGGSVGAHAVRIAADRDLRVVGIAGDDDAPYVRSLGAETVFDRDRDWVADVRRHWPGGAAGLIDCALVGEACLPAISDAGTMIALRPSHLPASPDRGIAAALVSVRDYYREGRKLAGLLQLVDDGPPPRIAKVFAASDASGAYAHAAERRSRGRTLVRF